MLSDDEGCGLLHDGLIQRIWVVGDVTSEKGRNHMAAPDAVVIALASGRVAGVEAVGHFIDGEDSNGGGEAVVEHGAKVGDWDRAGGLEGCDLSESVDSGVGAARALRQELFSGEALDDSGERALDGGLAGLDLPAVEGGAIIGESEFESTHCEVQGCIFRRESQSMSENECRLRGWV